MKTLITLFAILTLSLTAAAQPPDTLWTRTYGGEDWDYGRCVQQTSDGGYIITGQTGALLAQDYDVYLIKTDIMGSLIWQHTFGGSSYDYGYGVVLASDGGYLIAGSTESFGSGGSADVYLIKTDAEGDTVWTRTYGDSLDDKGYSVITTSDGGYIIAGSTESYGLGGSADVYLIKTDAMGNPIWERAYGGWLSDIGYSVQQTLDGGYVIAGWTISYGAGNSDVYLIKTDAEGDTVWTRTFGWSNWDYGQSVHQTADDGYIIAGYTKLDLIGNYDVYLIKTDANGNLVWQNTFGGSGWDEGHSVQQTSDGGYVIAGETGSYGAGGHDVYLIKTNSAGILDWQTTFGGSGWDAGYCMQQTSDSGYVLVGYSNPPGSGYDDIYLIKTDVVDAVKPSGQLSPPAKFSISPPYPNPFNPTTMLTFTLPHPARVTLEVFDINGRRVGAHCVRPEAGDGGLQGAFNAPLQETWYEAGTHTIPFDGTGLPSGIYLARLTAGEYTAVQKLALLK